MGFVRIVQDSSLKFACINKSGLSTILLDFVLRDIFFIISAETPNLIFSIPFSLNFDFIKSGLLKIDQNFDL